MNELLRKLRKYEIRIRKAINSQMQGDFRSVFKGSGLEFDDVRAYQYGDDIRSIDWNVSAKGHGTFVKTFREDKEQTVLMVFDTSGSQEIGRPGRQKADIGKEICSVLALSAARETSQVGMLCFSDRKEKYIKPLKGSRHVYEIINTLYSLEPQSRYTNLKAAFLFTMQVLKRRSVIIIVSDFLDEGYEHTLKGLARKHDVVMVRLIDPQETRLPRLGIVPVLDKESGRILWVNSSSRSFRNQLVSGYSHTEERLTDFCKRHNINFVSVDTSEDYVPKLLKLFQTRNKQAKRG
jgi:uncharacterized protein (DUF58 family)